LFHRSYDEKPGIQAIGNTAPDLPPVPGEHPTIGRDHEYVRHGTVSLMAGIDLLTGQVHGQVVERHRSREFIAFLKTVDKAYPADISIRVVLDNHSAHIWQRCLIGLNSSLHPNTDLGSTSSKVSLPKWPGPCSVEYASHPKQNSRSVS
jgi:hypothetical protein